MKMECKDEFFKLCPHRRSISRQKYCVLTQIPIYAEMELDNGEMKYKCQQCQLRKKELTQETIQSTEKKTKFATIPGVNAK